MNQQLWWHIARGSGLVAWALLTASVLWGVTLSTRLVGRAARPAWVLDLHRSMGGLACVFTGVHIAGLVADSWLHVGWTEVLVPLASRWHPVAVAWGVVALYLLVAVEATSLLGRRVPRRIWRRVHALSFVLWALTTVHLVTAGSDASNPIVLVVTWGAVLTVVFVAIVRVLSPKPESRSSRQPAGDVSEARGARSEGAHQPPPRRRTSHRPVSRSS